MLPYFEQPVFHIGGIPIHAFGIAVAIGVLLGVELARHRSPMHGVDPKRSHRS